MLYFKTIANAIFQISKLQDTNKALDRLTKSKEAALLEAERTVEVALIKASMVDDLQNRNQELMKQIEICQVHEVPLQIKLKSTCDLFLLLGICLGRKQNSGQVTPTKGCRS